MFLIIRSFVFNNFFQKKPKTNQLKVMTYNLQVWLFSCHICRFFESVKERK